MKEGKREEAYAVGNLLPSRSVCPFALVAKAVFVDIDDSLPALRGQLSKLLGAVAQLIKRARAVPVDDDIHILEQLLKQLPALWRLQVDVGRVLSHVAVHLEERHVAEVGAGHFEDVGAVLAEDSCDDGPGNDAAELEDLDARKEPAFLGPREGGLRC